MADNVLGTLFGDIANAIRSKTGDTAKMKPIDFPTKILEIEVGGGGSLDGWETVVEEQTATASYDSITLSNVFNVPSTINVGGSQRWYGLFKVWFDGVVYACAAYNYHYKFSKEVLGVTEVYSPIIGNPHLVKGRLMTPITCDSTDSFSEPFAIIVENDSSMHIAVNDTNPHTIRVDYIPRGSM
jgi:hypothetical protein